LDNLEDVGKYSHLLKRVNGHGRVSLLVITGDPPTQPQQPQQQQDWSRPRMGITEYKGTDEDILRVHLAVARTRFLNAAALDAIYKANHR
jgi:hypothetical protein